MKNDILKNHFLHPYNVGIVENYDHKIIVKSDQCNDVITFTVTITHNTIDDIKFEAYGCGYAIAGASLVSDAVKGKDIDLGIRDVEEMLNTITIPDSNLRCIHLSLKAIKQLKDNLIAHGHTA
ncbi:MAG TPA: iron-sulfur cluster assembly scaffold protein [Spirochaetota bacterium]|nr:iron-sulfur cluster assembly scaffold protein [Spirochaetota bacterium]HOM10945.1 iron-sulfur cluster assembly scaffold protein [Spirochaetota bacterium]HPP49772.1 iron-sulfur cluster assembly scaffold protein [Spirochaetota bacterium]HXK66533.1 iron-sulfur cluster assembly scaffold protein [Spirochaetota bacterium]